MRKLKELSQQEREAVQKDLAKERFIGKMLLTLKIVQINVADKRLPNGFLRYYIGFCWWNPLAIITIILGLLIAIIYSILKSIWDSVAEIPNTLKRANRSVWVAKVNQENQ